MGITCQAENDVKLTMFEVLENHKKLKGVVMSISTEASRQWIASSSIDGFLCV